MEGEECEGIGRWKGRWGERNMKGEEGGRDRKVEGEEGGKEGGGERKVKMEEGGG